MAVVAVINHKGGVGKTTTTVNLGAALQEMGKRVLLVDLDPQASLTIHLGVKHPETLPANCGHVLKATIGGSRSTTFRDVLTRTPAELDLIPSGWQLDDAEALLGHGTDWPFVLRECLAPLRDDYDYILVDCLPGRNFLVFNAVTAADAILVPLQADHLAAQGLALTFQTAVIVQQRFNPAVKVLGIVMTLVQRTKHSRRVVDTVRESFGDRVRVFETEVRAQVGYKESSRAGTSVLGHGPRSAGASTYRSLAAEVVAAAEQIGLHGAPAVSSDGGRPSALEEVAAIALAQAQELAWLDEDEQARMAAPGPLGGDGRVKVADLLGEETPAAGAEASRTTDAPEPEVPASAEPKGLPPVRSDPAPAVPGARPRTQPEPRAAASAVDGSTGATVEASASRPSGPKLTTSAEMCPCLGLSNDRTKRLPELNYAHRCWAGDTPVFVDLPTQQRTCLQSWYWSCPRYLKHSLANGGQQSKPSLFARLTSWLHLAHR